MASQHINLSLVIGTSLLALVAYTVGLIIYRIWLSPLSKYPGPKHMAVSDVFSQWHAFVSLDMIEYSSRLHQKYGPIVRIGPNRLAMEGSICWPEVYGARSTSEENEFSKIAGFTFPNDHFALIGAPRDDHRRQRRQMGHAFSAAALQEQEGILTQYIDKFMDKLTACAKSSQPTNIVDWFNYITFDIIGDLTFADSFHGLDGETKFIDNLFRGTIGMAYRRFILQFPLLKPAVSLYAGGSSIVDKAITGGKENFLLGRLKCQARMAMGAEPKDGRRDFATYMLRKGKDGSTVLSEDEIQGISSVLVVAGSETTATALSGFTFFMGMNPHKNKILVDEVRAAFSNESQITIASTARLPYLVAVIEETLRLYPPAAALPPRVSPGAEVNGQWVPRGTIIQTWQPATNRNPDSFADPDSFEPERWLNPQHPLYNPRYAHDKRQVVKPFSNGSRDCIGKNLAYAEMRTIICRLLFRFDIRLMPGQENWLAGQSSTLLRVKGPLEVSLTIRPGVTVE